MAGLRSGANLAGTAPAPLRSGTPKLGSFRIENPPTLERRRVKHGQHQISF